MASQVLGSLRPLRGVCPPCRDFDTRYWHDWRTVALLLAYGQFAFRHGLFVGYVEVVPGYRCPFWIWSVRVATKCLLLLIDSTIDFPWSLRNIIPFWAGADHHDFHHMAFVNVSRHTHPPFFTLTLVPIVELRNILQMVWLYLRHRHQIPRIQSPCSSY